MHAPEDIKNTREYTRTIRSSVITIVWGAVVVVSIASRVGIPDIAIQILVLLVLMGVMLINLRRLRKLRVPETDETSDFAGSQAVEHTVEIF
jgi:hypothetical protein